MLSHHTTFPRDCSSYVRSSSPTTSATCGTVSNTADVTASNDGVTTPTVANGHEASASEDVNCPSITITKTADAASDRTSTQLNSTHMNTTSAAGGAKNVTDSDTLPTDLGTSWSF